MQFTRHLIYGQDPNQAWCHQGRLDDNYEDLDEVDCLDCLRNVVSYGEYAAKRQVELLKPASKETKARTTLSERSLLFYLIDALKVAPAKAKLLIGFVYHPGDTNSPAFESEIETLLSVADDVPLLKDAVQALDAKMRKL